MGGVCGIAGHLVRERPGRDVVAEDSLPACAVIALRRSQVAQVRPHDGGEMRRELLVRRCGGRAELRDFGRVEEQAWMRCCDERNRGGERDQMPSFERAMGPALPGERRPRPGKPSR